MPHHDPSPDPTTATLDALAAEGDILERLVRGLDEEAWASPTPAAGWTVAHQIAHLAWTDEAASASLATPPETGDGPFTDYRRRFDADPSGHVDATAADGAAAPPAELLERWCTSRARLDRDLRSAAAGTPGRCLWFGPPMGLRSMATARLMETWAHGQDVADTLGVRRPTSPGLRDICHLGVVTRDFAYRNNSLTPPTGQFRVDLHSPDGLRWTWGPDDDAVGTVRGPALDFCLLVTQRREVGDLDLEFVGDEARRWAGIAQAFAGPPKAVMRGR
jgi:uncharacterized protein (TIGR03084 family)